jgi:uncharacterized protein YecE (DUF72 family)
VFDERDKENRRMSTEPEVRLGTSSFTAKGWETSFYPKGMKAAEYLTFYSTKFDTVEIDATFYRAPSAAAVNGWARKVPDGFHVAAKVPQAITHEKVMVDCDDDVKYFVDTMSLMGDKLGPLLFQFGYFNKQAFKTGNDFLARLEKLLKCLPKGPKFALEIRNKNWLSKPGFDLLRSHNTAFVLIDQSWMPAVSEIFDRFDPITAVFTYIRWLGDRKAIELQTKVWDKTVVDRTRDLQDWVKACYTIQKRGTTIFAYANNHYAGHAPATIKLFQDLYDKAK